MKSSYKYFENRECKYYPCHKNMQNVNCLFCYCPLYTLGDKCGGNYIYNKEGIILQLPAPVLFLQVI